MKIGYIMGDVKEANNSRVYIKDSNTNQNKKWDIELQANSNFKFIF